MTDEELDVASPDITVSAFYHSAVNEVTKPSSLVFVSHYFADRWMREMGPLGSALVICLRSKCYHDRSRGELRDRVRIAVPDIALEIGVSPKTVRRELENIAETGAPLARFLRVHISYTPGRTPESVRRDANTYQVAMDDPVHPLDEPELLAAVQAKEARAEKGGAGESEQEAKERARREGRVAQKPPGQNDHTASGGLVNLALPRVNLALGTPKMTRPSGQNDQALTESSSILLNPLNPSSEFLPAAVPGRNARENTEAHQDPQPWPFDLLPDAERSPWLDKAETELRQNSGADIWVKTKEKARASIRAQRAANLYATDGRIEKGKP